MAEKSTYGVIIGELKKYFRLKWTYAKLSGAEKITVLLSALATAGCIGIILLIGLFFLASAFESVLAYYIGAVWADLIIFAIFISLALVVFLFRKQLILNPICKLVSKTFLDNEDQ